MPIYGRVHGGETHGNCNYQKFKHLHFFREKIQIDNLQRQRGEITKIGSIRELNLQITLLCIFHGGYLSTHITTKDLKKDVSTIGL